MLFRSTMRPHVFIPFGEWKPDAAALNSDGVISCENLIVNADMYFPFPGLSVFGITSIADNIQGATIAASYVGGYYNFYGVTSSIFQLISGTLTNVTRAGVSGQYSTSANAIWDFCQFGEQVIATNGTDRLQTLTLGAVAFTNLAGGSFAAKTVAAVRDFVVAGNIIDDTYSVGAVASAQRIRWSGINNPATWTADPATLADFQDLAGEGGAIQKIIGGEYGVVLQRRAIFRMTFVGSPLVFQFDRAENNIGAMNQASVVSYKNMIFFLSDTGFFSFNGVRAKPIGQGKVDKKFFSSVDTTKISQVQGFVHPTEPVVGWSWPSTADAAPTATRFLMYNWAFDKWTQVSGITAFDNISTHISAGGVAGYLTLAIHPTAARISRFKAATALTAIIATAELQLIDGQRAMITELRPRISGLSVSIAAQVLVRSSFQTALSTGPSVVMGSSGSVMTRSEGRYHTIRMTIVQGTQKWENLQGVEVYASPTGDR